MSRAGSSNKLDPILNTKSVNNQDLLIMINNHIFNGFLRFKSWDFASMLGLVN